MPDPWTLLALLLNSGLHWLMAIGGVMVLLILLGHLLLALLLVIPTWRICQRAGFSGALSLLHFVPAVGSLVVMAILAFSDWPAGEARARRS